MQKLSLPISGTVYLLPVNGFPLPQEQLQKVREFCQFLITQVQDMSAAPQLEVILKQNSLYPDLTELFVDKATEWSPMQGVAVIPHKPPPHLPTLAELESIDVKSLDPSGSRPPNIGPELTFRVTDPTSKEEAWRVMLGHGAVNICVSRLNEGDLYECWDEIFGQRITERLFRAMPCITPLFGIQSFQNAREDEMHSWFDTFELYIGESEEDNGIVIAAKENLDVLIADWETELLELNSKVAKAETEILRW